MVVQAETTVREVKELLQGKPPVSSVIVASGEAPVGLLMKYALDRSLSSNYGQSLYHHRPVALVMDQWRLVVEADTPIEQVAQLAMQRSSDAVYDDIVVTEAGRIMGVVSVQRMLDSLAQQQVEMAKGANPLSGLPGNLAIEQEIERRAREDVPSSIAYVDLDNFKVYNDVYGFEAGDKVILLTAEALRDGLDRHGLASDMVGHVGGDDFIVIASPGTVEPVCRCAMDRFAARAPGLFTTEDLERGGIVGAGRDGSVRLHPLVSLSIGVLDCAFGPGFSMGALGRATARVKKAAKAIVGASMVRESASF